MVWRASSGTASGSVAAVLADLFLPDSSGLDTFAQLHGAAPQIPLLILIDTQHEPVARIALRQGAYDYFLRGHRDDWLLGQGIAHDHRTPRVRG